MSRRIRPLLIGSLVLLGGARSVEAHGFRPALLEIRELGEGRFLVVWKQPPATVETGVAGGRNLSPAFPEHCRRVSEPAAGIGAATVRHWIVSCGAAGLRGFRVGVAGLGEAGLDALVRITWADQTDFTSVLRPGAPFVEIPRGASSWSRLMLDYLAVGVEHILGGYDHLLFVAGLLVILRRRRLLFLAVTSFTVGHSLSLALVTLGLLRLPVAPVEAAIALSIVLLAVEALRSDPGSLTLRHPWAVASCFGLLHGFGFAGALAEVGLPPAGVPLALLGFNLGVEVGQIGFIGGCLAVILAGARVPKRWLQRGRTALVYSMGGIASFWCFQRVAAFAA